MRHCGVHDVLKKSGVDMFYYKISMQVRLINLILSNTHFISLQTVLTKIIAM